MVNFKMMTQTSFLDGLVPMACFMWKLYPFLAHTPEPVVRGQPATESTRRVNFEALYDLPPVPLTLPLCGPRPSVKSAFSS